MKVFWAFYGGFGDILRIFIRFFWGFLCFYFYVYMGLSWRFIVSYLLRLFGYLG